jgi:hypothetical protein
MAVSKRLYELSQEIETLTYPDMMEFMGHFATLLDGADDDPSEDLLAMIMIDTMRSIQCAYEG